MSNQTLTQALATPIADWFRQAKYVRSTEAWDCPRSPE